MIPAPAIAEGARIAPVRVFGGRWTPIVGSIAEIEARGSRGELSSPMPRFTIMRNLASGRLGQSPRGLWIGKIAIVRIAAVNRDWARE